jgi:hypothetical protein
VGVGVTPGHRRGIGLARVLAGAGADVPGGVGDPDPDAEYVRGARRSGLGGLSGLGVGDEREPEREAEDDRTRPKSAVHG